MLNLLKDIFPAAVTILTIVAIIYIILLPFIASWKLFKKVGIEGWKSLIPVYNVYLVFKIAGLNGLLCIPVIITQIYGIVSQYKIFQMPDYIVNIVYVIYAGAFIINIFRAINLAKVFKKGTGFTVGLVFLPEIFEIILGMGKSKYIGDYKPKSKKTN